jgi:hypothetical protein
MEVVWSQVPLGVVAAMPGVGNGPWRGASGVLACCGGVWAPL